MPHVRDVTRAPVPNSETAMLAGAMIDDSPAQLRTCVLPWPSGMKAADGMLFADGSTKRSGDSVQGAWVGPGPIFRDKGPSSWKREVKEDVRATEKKGENHSCFADGRQPGVEECGSL